MPSQCAVCAGMSISLLADNYAKELKDGPNGQESHYYEHHGSLEALEQAADDGCDFCSILVARLKGTPYSEDWPDDWSVPQHDIDNSMYDHVQSTGEAQLCIRMHSSMGYPSSEDEVRVFDLIDVSIRPYRELRSLYMPVTIPMGTQITLDSIIGPCRIGRHRLDRDLASPTNFKLVRTWLNDCQNNHPECNVDNSLELPTRVIDVGQDAASVKLIHTDGVKGRYVALSHCWGGSISTVLTEKDVGAFGISIPVAQLAANFKDAIEITRELGVQYLWIDSLCIIQDSKKDWEQESKTMWRIYRNSLVTIYAMVSARANDGILRSGRATSHKPDYASIKLFPKSINDDEIRIELESHGEDLGNLYSDGPLFERGWTLQEKALSPRHLYYGKVQPYWWCPKVTQFADGVPFRFRLPWSPLRSTPILRKIMHFDLLQDSSTPPDKDEIWGAYKNLVEEFSGSSLTFDCDKLPAFSGISQRFSRVIEGEYLAGIWKSHLNDGLNWRALTHPDRYDPRPWTKPLATYRAPSWSWASINTRVYHELLCCAPNKYNLQLLKHELTFCDESNPYGEVQAGYIQVKGHTATFKLNCEGGHIYQTGDDESKTGNVYQTGNGSFDRTGLSFDIYAVRPEESNGFTFSAHYYDIYRSWDHERGGDPLFEQEMLRSALETYVALLVSLSPFEDGKYDGAPESYDASSVSLSFAAELREDENEVLSGHSWLVLKEISTGVYERVGWFNIGEDSDEKGRPRDSEHWVQQHCPSQVITIV